MADKILVIAAHPDDEILGCGGTIAKHVKNGDEVIVVIMAEGLTSRDLERDRDKREKDLFDLGKIAESANKLLGVKSLFLHDLPDNRMDSVDRLEIIKVVENYIKKINPSTIYTHHSGDVNIDHRRIHEAVVTACRPQPNNCVKNVLFFEVASSTEWQTSNFNVPFIPNWFVDISETLALKLQALKIYNSEMRDYPHSRSIEALEYLAKWRGSCVGVESAEAFVLGRRLN